VEGGGGGGVDVLVSTIIDFGTQPKCNAEAASCMEMRSSL